jgi:hypothetical protein
MASLIQAVRYGSFSICSQSRGAAGFGMALTSSSRSLPLISGFVDDVESRVAEGPCRGFETGADDGLRFVGHAGDGFVGGREVRGEEFVEDGGVLCFLEFGSFGYGGDFDFEVLGFD